MADPLRLDLGCGQNKQAGFHGVDIADCPGVDTVFDLFTTPWPFESDSVDEVFSSHFFEHVPAKRRYAFMNELYRILKVGGKALIIVPYAGSMRAVQDASHEWPPICENSFLYYNRQWREANKLTHGVYAEAKCDFDFTYGFSHPLDIQVRSDEARGFAARHYLNSIEDVWTTLVKRAPQPE